MYHIFEEIPAAKAAIQDSFVKLYTKMDYDRMNIKLLCGEALLHLLVITGCITARQV